MSVRNLKAGLRRLEDIVQTKPRPTRKGMPEISIQDRINANIKYIEENLWNISNDIRNKEVRLRLFVILDQLRKARDVQTIVLCSRQMQVLLDHAEDRPGFKFNLSRIHNDVKEEMKADIEEMQKCFENECYRSAIILAGRVLEIALHRKYYEMTGQDILEKSPGIGLGKLVAKLTEKDIKLDPGLMQQIHLINNVRIPSVHKKQMPFNPSKAQTHATILFTLDIVEKLF